MLFDAMICYAMRDILVHMRGQWSPSWYVVNLLRYTMRSYALMCYTFIFTHAHVRSMIAIVICCDVLCCATRCYAMLCYDMRWYAAHSLFTHESTCGDRWPHPSTHNVNAMLCYVMLCYLMLWCVMTGCAIICCYIICYAMLCYALLCYAMPCYA